MADAIVTLRGRVKASAIEGLHYELEVADPSAPSPRWYVLFPAGDEINDLLQTSLGKDVSVTGYVMEGASVFMRGIVFRVLEVAEADGGR